MARGILCRNLPHTSQVHTSTHKVQMWWSVDTAGSCCSEFQLTSKHSSRHIPSGVSGSASMGDWEIAWLARNQKH